jgi:hypothetical protein
VGDGFDGGQSPRPGQVFSDPTLEAALQSGALYVSRQSDLLLVAETDLTMLLTDHAARVRRERAWEVPLAVSLSLAATTVTSTPHDFLGVKAATWAAALIGVITVFILLALFFGIPALWRLIRRERFADAIELATEIKSRSTRYDRRQ